MKASDRNPTRDPTIDSWLSDDRFGPVAHFLRQSDQLTGLLLAAKRREPPEFPEEILVSWHHLIIRQRRVVDQSESAFIHEARWQGWSWQRIADALGLPDASAAERRSEVLAAELARTHPNQNPKPWLRS